jgi:5-methylcytosine-specific restriction endonuclease McrA
MTDKERLRQHYLAHREEIIAHVRAYAQANKAAIAERGKLYRARNRAALAAGARRRYLQNREARIAKAKARAEAKREEVARYKQQWWASKRELFVAEKRARYENNREAILAARRGSYAADPAPIKAFVAKRRARLRQAAIGEVDYAQVLRDSGGICGICKQPLQASPVDIDHIVPLSKGGAHTQTNLQATHMRCNRRKGAAA